MKFCFLIFTLIGLADLQSTTGKGTTGQQTTKQTTPRTTQRTTPRTTTRPRPSICFVCSQCPVPFDPNNIVVGTTMSTNGWCAKKSFSSDPNVVASRGSDSGDCAYYGYHGCKQRIVQGQQIYLCCCTGDRCNTANYISKLHFSILLFSFSFLLFEKTSFFN